MHEICMTVRKGGVVEPGVRGCHGIAPDLGSRDDPQPYSPILADRWACGQMIEHFLEYIPAFAFEPQTLRELQTLHELQTLRELQTLWAFARRLLNNNPEARPELTTFIKSGAWSWINCHIGL
ncbi:hypothetical protein BC826DRAFT_1125595 [Russula brevipes]|nr:hypothetical protein BC826DRAFT_1125595 [Russula brevipes]